MKHLKFNFDENLREAPEKPEEWLRHIDSINIELKKSSDPLILVRKIGELGTCQRILHKLDEAQANFETALQLIDKNNLGVELEVQNQIRLAHVHQWKKDFSISNKMFSLILENCQKNENLKAYLPFAYQHLGKNLYDQGLFAKALESFEKALKLRIKNHAPTDQVESSRFSIKQTKKKLS